MICPACGSPYLTALLDCVECGCCAVCYPYECSCVYWEDEDGEYQEREEEEPAGKDKNKK